MLATIQVVGKVMVVIEMVVDEQDDRKVYKVGKVATKEWTKAKSADTGFVFVLAAKTIQALNFIKPGLDMYFISPQKCYLP